MSDLIDQPGASYPPSMGPVDVLGFDPYDPDFPREPYACYREMSARSTVFRTRAGLLIVTTQEHCGAMLRDPRFGHGSDPLDRRDAGQPVESFLRTDPPDHTRLRALVCKAFTPRMLERPRPRIGEITAELIGALPDEADLVSGFAYPLPVMVITEMLGVPPKDQERFRGWSEILAHSLDPMLTDELVSENRPGQKGVSRRLPRPPGDQAGAPGLPSRLRR